MPAVRPRLNLFKAALKRHHPQFGFWMSLGDALVADLCAGIGFDWLLIDGEHSPFDVHSILHQIQAVGERCPVIVRPPADQCWMIQQLLDMGVQTILLPRVETSEQAVAIVRATRYPPTGIRGVASSLTRASSFGRDEGYLRSTEICLLALVESQTGLKNIDAIVSVEGIDGVFFGAADLAADLGELGKPTARAVQVAINNGIVAVRKQGKAAGAFAADCEQAQRLSGLGASFFSVGADVTALARGADSRLHRFANFQTRGDEGPHAI